MRKCDTRSGRFRFRPAFCVGDRWRDCHRRGGRTPAAARPAGRAPPAAGNKTAAAVLVRLSLPIKDNGSSRFIRTVRRALPKLPPADVRPVLIVEFSVGQSKDGEGSDFNSANAVAEYLIGKELGHVRTVAYIPETIRGHAVLAALACREIIMATDAEIGDAGCDEPDMIPIRKETYRRIASATLNVPPAVALKMLDKNLDVRKVVHEAGTDYVLADKVDEIKSQHTVQEVTPLKGDNLFSGNEGRIEPRFVSQTVKNRSELAEKLGVPARRAARKSVGKRSEANSSDDLRRDHQQVGRGSHAADRHQCQARRRQFRRCAN